MTQLQTLARTEIRHARLMEGQIPSSMTFPGSARAAARATRSHPPRSRIGPAYRTRVANGTDALRATLAEIGTDAASTPFQTSAWIEAWLSTIGMARNCDMHVAEIRDHTTGELQFALPLVRHRRGLIQILEMPDFGLADYCGPLLKRTFHPDKPTMKRLWADINSALPRADVLKLGNMPARIGEMDNPLLLLAGLRQSEQSAWAKVLTCPPDDFSALDLPRRRARELKNRLNRMQAIGQVTFRVAHTTDEMDRFFEAMCRQRARRHIEMNRPNSLDHADIRAFFRALLADGTTDAQARIEAVMVGDEIVATGYGLISQHGFHMIFATIEDGIWRPLSPGLQYFRMSMAEACRNGRTHYDFTIGSEQYKAELGATEQRLFDLVQPLSASGHIMVACARTRRFIRSQPRLARLLRTTARTLNLRSA